jgi:hypothetical protein
MAELEPPIDDVLRQMFWFDDQQNAYREQMATALMAFNRIENYVSELIGIILDKAGRSDMLERQMKKGFMSRVDALEMLAMSVPGAPPVPYSRLAALAGTRNDFAHGHFSTDDNSGSLVIKGKGKVKPWDPTIVEPFLEECRALRLEMSRILAYVMFGVDVAEIASNATRQAVVDQAEQE